MIFNKEYSKYKTLFEEKLNEEANNIKSSNETLKKAMQYSLKAGGKRLRPVLMLATAELLGLSCADVMPYALAIEYIHTYSLIHDDLPDMDNDDLRRGKPTNHKVFGNAMAILAGDALLNLAYETCFRAVKDINGISACRMLSLYAGAFGMVGGQATDIESQGVMSEGTLLNVHLNKTGRLILASVLTPSALFANLYFNELSNYGKNLGYLFQVTDDILDYTSTEEVLGKSINKDKEQNKLTFVSLYGIDGARKKAEEYYNNAVSALDGISKTEFLIELLNYVKNRNN
ncbi:MAG: polyprenyl synthetase family protein [Clostridia bacterium]|nr:polyprenyl synthetase family protein [Clostridia bacterium]